MPAIDLTPAEAMVLLDPNLKQGRNPFKVSLMWLLAQRHLKATEVKRGWLRGRTTQLSGGPRARTDLPDDLQAVMNVVRVSGTGLMDDVVKAARNLYGTNLLGFQNDLIYPALVARGLITRSQETYLTLFTRDRWDQTPAGKALAQRIEVLFEDARRIPGFLDRSPAQAAALTASLGGLILLMPELRPYLEDIADVMRRPQIAGSGGGGDSGSFFGGSGGSSGGTGSGRPAKEEESTVPTSSGSDPLDFRFEFDDFDFGNIDGLDASLSALDSSFDSSADGAAGGDGGGGDGGGGGD